MLRVLLALMLLFGAPFAAHANEVPERVQRFLDEARNNCLKAGGTPAAAPKITSLDLNGDGHPDWIVHYEGYCLTAPNQSCAGPRGNCVIEIFLGQPDGSVRFFLMQSTISWRTDRILGRPALIFHRPNDFCRDRKQQICDERYIFERNGGFRHLPYR